MKKTSFKRGMDPLTTLSLGNIRIVENWMAHYGIPFKKKGVKRSRNESGHAIIEMQVDGDMNASIVKGNPDWKSGRTGNVKIIFHFED